MESQAAHNRCWRVGGTRSHFERKFMLGTVLVVLLVLMLIGALPTWPHSRNWGAWSDRRAGLGSGNSGCPAFARHNLSGRGANSDAPRVIGTSMRGACG